MFGEPDADWTDEWPWTRYRGPQPWPVPGDWVLGDVEADGAMWQHFPGHGEGCENDHEVYDALDDDLDAIEDARGARAILLNELEEFDRREKNEAYTHTLIIDGDEVIEAYDPEWDDLFESVAQALKRYESPGDPSMVEVESGKLTDEQRREKEIEARRQENQSLGAFAREGGDGRGE